MDFVVDIVLVTNYIPVILENASPFFPMLCSSLFVMSMHIKLKTRLYDWFTMAVLSWAVNFFFLVGTVLALLVLVVPALSLFVAHKLVHGDSCPRCKSTCR